MSPLIETQGVTRVLPAAVPVTLVQDITLAIGAGEFVAITGPSGSGKSSLLYLLGLLDRPTSGTLAIEGRDTAGLTERERAAIRLGTLGFVFQFHFLLPEFTVRENVEIPMRRLGRLGTVAMRDRSTELLSALGLHDHLDKRPDQLSGGQRQRVAVARSLANDPPLILADEPTGSLDSRSSEQVFSILDALVRERGKTVIAVTHDTEMAAKASRRIHLVDGRLAES
ncbi:lipoprotein-releasing system ATP-binding protein [Bosea sp. CRIB-10]|uniref:ABC transporter ATP-binding protein n=1 Tax=Bosea sp. CRIB-10 TaxID=378404 RepID=UPI0008E18638|nr:ABC transporter ATP-binding protein [Bosea sp. CRIB-10]SFC57549.1 lipoprotein-releasing system ATP-binding protein [Bosea sp. CRIB-10]